MTVQELIDALQAVEDKSQPVAYSLYEYGTIVVDHINQEPITTGEWLDGETLPEGVTTFINLV